jgi:hypothetical protein
MGIHKYRYQRIRTNKKHKAFQGGTVAVSKAYDWRAILMN